MKDSFPFTRKSLQKAMIYFNQIWDIEDMVSEKLVPGIGECKIYSKEYWDKLKEILPTKEWIQVKNVVEDLPSELKKSNKVIAKKLKDIFGDNKNLVHDIGFIPGIEGTYYHPDVIEKYIKASK